MGQAKSAKKPQARSAEQSRAAILDATRTELAENGWRKFSVDRVAKTARASKQTIYRNWPATGTMCVQSALDLIPARGQYGRDPAERIADLIKPLESALQSAAGHDVLRGAVIAASDEPEAGELLRNWIKDEIRAPLRLCLAEFATKKVTRRDVDLDDCVHFLIGPIWNRILVSRAPVEEGYSQEQARLLLDTIKYGA